MGKSSTLPSLKKDSESSLPEIPDFLLYGYPFKKCMTCTRFHHIYLLEFHDTLTALEMADGECAITKYHTRGYLGCRKHELDFKRAIQVATLL